MTRLASRTSRLRELERLLLLAPGGLGARELAERLGVNRRTIYRDLDFLSVQEVPVWQQGGRFGINRTGYLATVRLSFHEAMALVLAGLLFARTIDQRNPHVESALRKLAVTLPHPFTYQLERAAARVEAQTDGRRQVKVLETLAEGWGTHHKVQIGYRSPRSGTLRDRVLSPYAIEPTPTGIYVIGHDDWAEDIRTFKLERLEAAVLMVEPYEIPADFDPDVFLATGWRIMAGEGKNEVTLRFSAAATPHVHERHWHPSQELVSSDDGGCTLKVQVADPREMQPWIRSWGAQVEVLAPAWLREQIGEELKQAAARYA